jgi:hypothetical protein
MDVSAAATVSINTANIWPKLSSRATEKHRNEKFMDNKHSSIDISINRIFFLLKTIPDRPIKKAIPETKRYANQPI